jgi:hypothetical protein
MSKRGNWGQISSKLASSDMTDTWQIHRLPKSLLVPPKFSYITNCSPKPLPWDKKHCSLVVMSKGGVSYLIIVENLMQNWGYIYSILLDFLDSSNFSKTSGALRCNVRDGIRTMKVWIQSTHGEGILLTPKGSRMLLRSPVWEKLLKRRTNNQNWCTNKSYRSWIF